MKIKTLIIAEAGVNHNGNLKTAYKLIDQAKYSGADFVKFQAYETDEICLETASLSRYQRDGKFKNQFDMLKKYELSKKQIILLHEYANKKKIRFLLSFFDIKSLEIIKDINLDYIKVPSGEISNHLLLKKISKLNKNVIFSTGMSNLIEIKKAIKILLSNGLSKKKITALYCISSYPTLPSEIYLPEINKLKKKLKINIGFSDHSKGKEAITGSVALGASIIEKHLTLNNKMKGPDHKASTEPEELRKIIKSVRNLEKMFIGKNNNKDHINKKFVRKSLVAAKNINKGEIFSEKNLTLKRPMIKNNSNKFFKIIGKKSQKKYSKNQLI